jgi:hypothetical protein
MLSKIYAVQPYEVGPKNRKKKSLVLGIPSKIAEECNINTSTIFAIQIGDQTKTITLQMLNSARQNEIIPVAASFEANSNQVSEEVQ